VRCSAASGEGLSDLSKVIEEKIYGGLKRTEDPVLTNVRHIDLVRRARESLGQACAMIGMGQALDIIEIDVRQAFDLLGEITGDSASDEVIDAVFERFCLGK
ncbi:MAG: tRNA uridine-5-carboxymethylaminomethyl(34) synthesis GTPase MnmE, partial [Firmicutes bacterium]|nr:tRNA uridine-5-carboxymethylaminomethyl(34) synthesis GTPase MnmE [Bacillota bacterium]